MSAVGVCGTVDGAVWHQLQIAIPEEHLYRARSASDVAEVRRSLRARLRRGRRGAWRQRERREEQPQRARARAHGAPRPLQPPGRRHCSTPGLMPRTEMKTQHTLSHYTWSVIPESHYGAQRVVGVQRAIGTQLVTWYSTRITISSIMSLHSNRDHHYAHNATTVAPFRVTRYRSRLPKPQTYLVCGRTHDLKQIIC